MIIKKREHLTCYNHGKDGIDLRHLGQIPQELRPIEVHRKEDGSIDNKPSFLFVMQDRQGHLFVAQITEATLFDAIENTMQE